MKHSGIIGILAFAAALGIGSATAHAQVTYTITPLVTTGQTIGGQALTGIVGNPVINDSGTVAFFGQYQSGTAIFTQSGLVVQQGQTIGGHTISGFNPAFLAINNSGTVVFMDSTQVPKADFLLTQSALLAQTGSTIGGQTLSSLGGPSINSNGSVVFYSTLSGGSAGVFTPSSLVHKIGDTIGGLTVSAFPSNQTAIDDNGNIAFSIGTAGGSAIVRGSTILAQTGSTIGGQLISSFGNVSVSHAGMLAFRAFMSGGAAGIFTPTAVLAKTGSTIGGQTLTSIFDPVINDGGTAVFVANTAAGNVGLFTQSNLIMKTGDVIGGKTVASINTPAAINNQGVIADLVLFSDNSEAIVLAQPNATPPFGVVDTPIDGSTGIVGAVGVTGWALGTTPVTSVKIYREPPPGQGTNLIYIGDAVFISGSRPDVAAAYPGYPYNSQGWGYAILTNELPNGDGSAGIGNGTYRLHAIAYNAAGQSTDIGVKTITVDNAHATVPFGTIDTPAQGGTVSGSNYVNFGWALTQAANIIPVDGHTITVYIDNVAVGHPNYNNPRADIQMLFPGLQNTNGAIGYFNIDTTKLANGLHTIAWSVTDSAGHVTGIGSRFFNVEN